MTDNEKIKPYKPLPKGSKFRKPNKEGQVPVYCVNFNFVGWHCCRFVDNDINNLIECNCCVLDEKKYCENYEAGRGHLKEVNK